MEPYATTDEVLEGLRATGTSYRVLDRSPFGHPIVVAKTGGDRQPAVLITAGAHATEHAGVRAAVTLAASLDTELATYVIPTRDPVGLEGYPAALSEAVGEEIRVSSFPAAESLLEKRAELVHRDDDVILALIGDIGFATMRPGPKPESSQLRLLKLLKRMQHDRPELLKPFRGRRIILPAGQDGMPGSGDFSRAYTLVVGPDGRLLHLNRFFDSDWAPPEVRAVRRVMAETEPALTVDLHETQQIDDRFYFIVNRHGADDTWERQLGEAIHRSTAAGGATFGRDADLARVANITVADPAAAPSGIPVDFERRQPGHYYSRATDAGAEGQNAGHFAAAQYGVSIGTETGMWGAFDQRVRILQAAVAGGVTALEARR